MLLVIDICLNDLIEDSKGNLSCHVYLLQLMADTTINIDKIWNIPGIVHINGTSNLTSTLFFNGSADMSTGSGLLDCESQTQNLEIYMDNLHYCHVLLHHLECKTGCMTCCSTMGQLINHNTSKCTK